MMFDIEESRLLNSQVGALKECIDLCRNKYFVRVQHFCPTFWYMRLKHYHNGRELVIWWQRGFYQIKEDSKLLKQQDYPEEINAQRESTKQ